MEHQQVYDCDVAVIGGGVGGVAAVLAAVDLGCRVILTTETDWLGGQMTSQGVSALDEHPHIESFGGTRTYYALRDRIRAIYQERYNFPAAMPDGGPLNPGNGWVSTLCFEPRIGAEAIEDLIAPLVLDGRLQVLRQVRPVSAQLFGTTIAEVVLALADGSTQMGVRASYYVDATELGDLLPITGTAYVSGAESREDTGEPHASGDGPHPDEVQGFTYCFAVEHCPSEEHTIGKPAGYESLRDRQPYTFVLRGHHGEARPFRMFSTGPTGLPPFWTYRRLVDGHLTGRQRDVALINWPGNDYHWANVIDQPAEKRAQILDEAKRLALGFLYWLQTEAPGDNGSSNGYPGLRLLPEVMGTADGLSKEPYIRESRRILSLRRIVEGDIVAEGQEGARSRNMNDAVGLGWYAMDLHDCVGNPRSMFAQTLPFQIPLGALIPRETTNLVAGCKNIGTTHLTNGAYRLHPVEWSIGEAAGTVAATCCHTGRSPYSVREDRGSLRQIQYTLLRRGAPVAWSVDVPESDPLYVPAQMLMLMGAIPPRSARADRLDVCPEEPLSGIDGAALLAAWQRLTRPGVLIDDFWFRDAHTALTSEDLAPVLRSLGIAGPERGDLHTFGGLCMLLAPSIEDTLV